jgi:hypothetical protein
MSDGESAVHVVDDYVIQVDEKIPNDDALRIKAAIREAIESDLLVASSPSKISEGNDTKQPIILNTEFEKVIEDDEESDEERQLENPIVVTMLESAEIKISSEEKKDELNLKVIERTLYRKSLTARDELKVPNY